MNRSNLAIFGVATSTVSRRIVTDDLPSRLFVIATALKLSQQADTPACAIADGGGGTCASRSPWLPLSPAAPAQSHARFLESFMTNYKKY